MKKIHIKLLDTNVNSLSCQISLLLQEKNLLEKQETRISILEKENEKLKYCQEETPTKGELHFQNMSPKKNKNYLIPCIGKTVLLFQVCYAMEALACNQNRSCCD
jgi:hypothetical protein